MMRSEQIKSTGQNWSRDSLFNSLLTKYHAPTAKKIPENQQKEMYDIFKTTMIYFYDKVC